MTSRWRPTASREAARARAAALGRIREFFSERRVLEVDTPLLGPAPATDPSIECIAVPVQAGGARTLFLQASPEHAMKRLLAADWGAIYALTKAFRDAEAGRYHNPEFTLLEWYRPGFDHFLLMQELEALVRAVGCALADFGAASPQRSLSVTYRDAFRRWGEIDPFTASDAGLREMASELGISAPKGLDRDGCLDLLMTHRVQPLLRDELPGTMVFLHGYPPSQAAMARLVDGAIRECDESGTARPEYGVEVAARFELFIEGNEIANGYWELTDAAEQARRFEAERARRAAEGRSLVVDTALLAAMAHGLPACAGVALGLDRLLMSLLGAEHIQDVLTFPVHAL